jgi:hypothetical protein
MKIGTKLFSAIALMAIVVLVVGGAGFNAAKKSHSSLTTVYKDRVQPLEQLKTVSDMYAVNIVDTAHKARDGTITWENARKNVEKAQKKIAEKWTDYLATHLDPAEQKLVDEIFPLLRKMDGEVLRLKSILGKEDRDTLRHFAATELYPAVDPLTQKIDALVEIQLVVAEREFVKSQSHYLLGQQLSLYLLIIGLLLSGGISIAIIRRLLNDLGGEPSYVREIAQSVAEGNLSIPVEADAEKKGSILWAMKIMVGRLSVLLSEKENKNFQLEKMAEKLHVKVAELEAILDQVKQLEGIIPICMHCKEIRDDHDSWHKLEDYITAHSEAHFSHGICNNCLAKYYPEDVEET